ncbi:2-trimethylaminoethylphosphonate dioxygenase [Saccharospirillum impatiens]|uniref:2-trimethylaminoethylphosphonate dioxygenase n=1 Tax=Saccharospirillum impatiens TaxID=169438 RepID=UPI0004113B73|nr:TauD/TfdA family dioxygenase [Saccharospirillum impatiens]
MTTAKAQVRMSADQRRLILDTDGVQREFAALWLRERAPDANTLDPRTGQRLIEAAELPLDLTLTGADRVGDQVELRFSDGTQTRYELDDLTNEEPANADADRLLWDASLASVPRAGFADALANDAALLGLLDQLHRFGFVLVDGVPTEEDGMQPLIDRIGPLRRTNWGGIADVKSVADAYDLTMTQRGLEPHTDNPYRDPIPGYIWLHCLSNAADSGDSTLADGFMAAERLKTSDPSAFQCLTRVWPGFRYQDETTFLESEGPLIELDSHGTPVRVRYSNRTERVPALAPDELDTFYAARQAFYRLVTSPELTVNLKLAPGQMLIMDNYRLLHGRKAFQLDGGIRHLRQGYVDRDSTTSRRRVLKRQLSTHLPESHT